MKIISKALILTHPSNNYGQSANNAVHFEDAMSEIARIPTKITELDADAGHLIR